MSDGQAVKYEGTTVVMDGREWVIPALSVRQFKEHYKVLTETGEAVTNENFLAKLDEFMPIILVATKRNYPDVTEDQLLDMIDMRSFPVIIRAIAAASGVSEAKPGE